LIWRDATESTLIKLKWDWKITTILWKQKISISGTFAASYTKGKINIILNKKAREGLTP
jgi:hypothetical protein